MAFKVFTVGEVLTSSDVNNYLMEQAVITCTSGTRPSAPNEGMEIYETDTDLLRVYDGSTWQLVSYATGTRFARKTSDETVNNSAVLQNDDHLFVSVAANAVYDFRLRLFINSPVTPDFQMAWSVPSGTTMAWGVVDVQTGTLPGKLSESSVGTFVTSGADQSLFVEGLVITSSTAGNLQLRWAQNGATASNTVVQSGSSLLAVRVA